jgi:hypothetical protein
MSSVMAAAAALVVGTPAVAHPDSPPAQWDNLRILDCAGVPVEAHFTPGGVFTSFHVVGSSDVIIPKHVEVVFPGETTPVTTLHVRGFDVNARDVVVCNYIDPAGLAVEITGIRT